MRVCNNFFWSGVYLRRVECSVWEQKVSTILYIKSVQNLQVPLLLAGRFEGATQEIKQSITDYMNGWRYERGIIYEQGENFEHYLRRVIRHIIDLQNRKESP